MTSDKTTNEAKISPQNSISNKYMQLYAIQYGGKLLLKKEINLPSKTFQLLVKKQYFQEHKGMIRKYLSYQCVRCQHSNMAYFQQTPCLTCDDIHYYCRKCVALGKIMECTILYEWQGPQYNWPKHKYPLSWKGSLTETQEAVSEQLIDSIEQKKEHLVWAVTGSGKTEMLFPVLTYALEKGMRICLATPRADVVRELLPRMREAFATVPIQGLYGGSRDNDGTAQIIIATTHQLLRYKAAFDLLIIDEVDAFPYHQDQSLHFAAKRACKKVNTIIYLTATPRKELQQRMQRKQLTYSFVPLRFHHQLIPMPQLQYCGQLSTMMIKKQIPLAIRQWFHQRQQKQRQLLLFVPTIENANDMHLLVASYLSEEKWVKSKNEVTFVTSEDIGREEKIEAFRNREIYCLITTTILERGVTFPSVDVAVIQANHHVFDTQALVQITGRAGRAKDDPTGEVVFFHDGKTNDIQDAIQMITLMNKQATNILTSIVKEDKQ